MPLKKYSREGVGNALRWSALLERVVSVVFPEKLIFKQRPKCEGVRHGGIWTDSLFGVPGTHLMIFLCVRHCST